MMNELEAYKKGYLSLFNGLTDIIYQLVKLQQCAEENYIAAGGADIDVAEKEKLAKIISLITDKTD